MKQFSTKAIAGALALGGILLGVAVAGSRSVVNPYSTWLYDVGVGPLGSALILASLGIILSATVFVAMRFALVLPSLLESTQSSKPEPKPTASGERYATPALPKYSHQKA